MTSDADLQARLDRLTPKELAELDRLLLSLAPRPLYQDWLPEHFPRWQWNYRHHRCLIQHIQAWYDTPGKNLGIVAPIRHGKSELITRRLPAYCLSIDPTARLVFGGYTATFARYHARHARRNAKLAGVALDDEKGAVHDWETTKGGGMFSVGVGEGVTGRGANFIIVDDPVKNREEAESEVYRQKVWDWFNDDLLTRKEPGARVLVTMARWHEDDLVGRIQASGYAHEWEWIRLPALAELDDPLGRKEGEALWPERMDEKALASARLRGEYSFAALYQGRPIPKGGNMFPGDRVQIVDAVPSNLKWVRYWDNAGTEGGEGARTAGVKLACHKGLWYVGHCEAFRLDEAARDARQKITATTDGHDTTQWLEQEPGSAGKSAKAVFIRNMAPYAAYGAPASGDKVTRAEGWAAQWQAGNVRLLRGDWNAAYIREHGSFPLGRTKDMVDASSGAFHKVASQPTLAAPLLDLVKESHWS